jgi:hypothetical protein
MISSYTRALIGAAVLAGMSAAACGGLPTAPSQEGATIAGTVAGGGSALSTFASGRGAATASSTFTVSVAGTNISATLDGGGNFVLNGVPAGDIQLVFSDASWTATLSLSPVSPDQLVQLLISISGGTINVVSETRSEGKVELCHRTDSGSYQLIDVSVNAEPAHRAHGDGKIGDPVPADLTKVFNRQCRPVPPGVDIEKLTNGQDADQMPGPSITVGSPVAWTYVVTNTSTVTLTNVAVVDDRGVVVSCPKTTLAVNESMTCTGSGVATLGQYRNVGTVTASSSNGPYTDSDASNYLGVVPNPSTEPKVQLCHRTGNGSYHLIEVGVSAEPAHRAHGDAKPGEAVPGSSGNVFSPSCVVQ